MKRFFLFLFASLLSISMFAAGETGKTKAQAIPYDWSSGIYVSSEAGVGKWYVVPLLESDGGPFKTTGKTADGKTDINITIVNPLGTEVDINCTAYIGDNETNRQFKMAAGGSKSMTFGAGMFVRMGINEVYLYLVTDVTVSEEQAQEQHQAVNVEVQTVEANSVSFVPVDFDWNGFGLNTPAAGNNIAANKETWLKIDWQDNLQEGYTLKLYAQNLGTAATTVNGGLAMDCPATNIQEQSKDINVGTPVTKVIDQAMLSMMPGTIYLRLKADQPLHVWAEQVAPIVPATPLFNANDANTVTKGVLYNIASDSVVYKADSAQLFPNNYGENTKYYAVEVIITNNGTEDAVITGKVAKNVSGPVNSAVTRTYTVKAGQTITKKLDNTLLSNMHDGDEAFALVLNGSGVSFILKDTCLEENPCVPAQAIDMVIPATTAEETVVSKNQAANTTKWYAVDVTAAKAAQADIELRMTTANAETADLTVDIAAVCAIGEPTQSYTGSSASTTKTLSYSLFKSAGDVVYVRVKTNKAISVEAEIISQVKYTSTGWNQDPSADKAARIEANLEISNKLEVLGITLAGGNIHILNGGKLIVGTEGIKGSESVDQIVIEEGGKLFIDPACTTNNKPFITAKKKIELGEQTATGHQLPELHDFIALPIEDREAKINLDTNLYYANWVYTEGWRANDNFRKAFVGYNVYIPSGDATCPSSAKKVSIEFKGRLAVNKDQTLVMPGEGWHAFGNSWFDAIDVAKIYNQLGGGEEKEVAVHKYVATPQDVNGVPYLDNQYALITSENKAYVTDEFKVVAPMQGFFLYTAGAKSITLDYDDLFNTNKAAAAPARRAESNNATNVAVVVRGGNGADHVFMVEKTGSNVHKMMGNGLALYAEDGLGQVANSNLIGTILTLETNEATEYTLSFAWLNGETLYLKDLANGNIIAMTAENTYTFNAEPNTVSERFQVIGRHEVPTNIENGLFIEGANKFIENGKIVIIKNGVKYDVLGAQL